MTDVKCKVQTCYYWGNNDICKADSILVDNNTVSGGRSTPMETGNLEVSADSGRRNKESGGRSASRDFEVSDLDTRTGSVTKTQSQVQAHTSHETLCSTFRPKGSEQPKH
ncbi:MAG: DUF1540 domain-containing protein [Bacillota bacterium]